MKSIPSIGIISSPYKKRSDAPRQGFESSKISKIILYSHEVMKDLKNEKRLVVLYWMHLADRSVLWSKMRKRGVFATRSPDRPNPIGISTVKVVKAEGNALYVKHLDAIDGTPVIGLMKATQYR